MNETTKHCAICGLDKHLSKMYSRKLDGVVRYSIGCQECYNNKVRHKRELKKLIKTGVLEEGATIPTDTQYCHRCQTFKLLSQYRTIKIRGKPRLDTQCNTCINKKDKTKYQKLLKRWETDPSDRRRHYKMQRASMNRRMLRDPIYHMTIKCRDRFKQCLRSGREWESHLECSLEFLRGWFEYQFRLIKTFDGIELSWDNRSDWHVDHVIPCKSFDFSDLTQRKICFHWSNLAPYPALDNLHKSNKIIPRLIKRQLILANLYKNLTGNIDKTVKIADICDYTGALTTAVSGKSEMQQVE